jgi:hypothetical protein
MTATYLWDTYEEWADCSNSSPFEQATSDASTPGDARCRPSIESPDQGPDPEIQMCGVEVCQGGFYLIV